MLRVHKAPALLAAASLFLSSCVTSGMGGGSSGIAVGPQTSAEVEADEAAAAEFASATRPRLDIIIPVFDPGYSDEDRDNYRQMRIDGWRDDDNQPITADDYVWPRLRQAEAVRFAWLLKAALEKTRAFGAVRVTPDTHATGDLYLLGRILESDGEEVEFNLRAVDITGRSWFSKDFDHEVEEKFYKNTRNSNKEPYAPAFQEAAEYLVKQLRGHDDADIARLQKVGELRFASHFSNTAFEGQLVEKNGRYDLKGFPSADDPMLTRTRAIRVRDRLFVDDMQQTYRRFSADMEQSYRIWQQQSAFEIAAKRKAQMEAAGEAALGVLAIGLGILAVAAGSQSGNSYNSGLATTAGAVAGVAGVALIADSFQTAKEANVHRDSLEELGQSIDAELDPQVVKFAEQTVELKGTASEQFAQWRQFLKKIYAMESVPDTQL